MFVNEKSTSNKWKYRAVNLLDNTISSVDQAISSWFWSLISNLPRDYFAKTFDQVNYFDQSIWEGMFRARVEELKEQLESGLSERAFEAEIIKLQGLIGKHSVSPLVYEDGLKELEDFASNKLDNSIKLFTDVRNEFREELKAQPLLLKECIKSHSSLGKEGIAYYNSLLDNI